MTSLKKIETILIDSVNIEKVFDWEKIKDKTKFSVINPKNYLEKRKAAISKPIEPTYGKYTIKPDSKNFIPKFSFFERLLKSKSYKEAKIEQYAELYTKANAEWNLKCKNINSENQIKIDYYKNCLAKYEEEKKQYFKEKFRRGN